MREQAAQWKLNIHIRSRHTTRASCCAIRKINPNHLLKYLKIALLAFAAIRRMPFLVRHNQIFVKTTSENFNIGASCEFCPEYHICNRCEQGYNLISQISRVHSPNHIHELLHFDKAQGEDWFEAGYHDGTFICDICKQTCNNGVYHCPICSYDECEKCAAAHNPAPQNVDQEMKIELGHLQQFFRTDGNDFDFDCRDPMRTPQHCSVITNKPWDLTNIETAPVPHAYCEFKLKKFLGNVSIGVGNTVFTPIQMLGYQQNSMAYFCNGSISRNNVDHRENYLPTFKRKSPFQIKSQIIFKKTFQFFEK
jgi:hypothetical protein